jgi:hypothetical protein
MEIDPRLEENSTYQFIPVEEKVTSNTMQEGIDNVPLCTSPEWNAYVLSFFVPEEMFEGHPTVDGLRRVAELLLGEITRSTSEVIQTPTEPNQRATVIHTITFLDNKTYSGSADSYWGNTDKPYCKYPVSIAETRAEARALRRALKLRNIVSADEMSKVALKEDSKEKGEKDNDTTEIPEYIENINDTQINCINIICNRIKINVEKFVKTHFPNLKNIKLLKHPEAVQLLTSLQDYQQNIDKIPSDVAGFDSNWKSSFC